MQTENKKIYSKRAMLFLFVDLQSENLSGYSSNSLFEFLNPFSSLTEELAKINQLLDKDDRYRVSILNTADRKSKYIRCHKFYIVEILYRQHSSWQGVLNGVLTGRRMFKSLEELVSHIVYDKTILNKKKQMQ